MNISEKSFSDKLKQVVFGGKEGELRIDVATSDYSPGWGGGCDDKDKKLITFLEKQTQVCLNKTGMHELSAHHPSGKWDLNLSFSLTPNKEENKETFLKILSTFNFLPSISTDQTNSTTGWKTYKNEKYHFSFKYPDYFKYLSLSPPDGSGVYLAPSEGSGEGKGSPFGLDLTKDSWFSASATVLDSVGLKYWEDKFSDSIQSLTASGVSYYKIQVLPIEASEAAYGYEAIIIKENTLYKLGLVAANKEIGHLPEREKMFDQILSTFKFTN